MSDSVLHNFLVEMPDLPEFTGIPTVGVHTRGLWQNTPLHVAAVRGDVAAIAALLDAGADIQSRGELGNSPLHEAVAQGHLPAVRLLLERGASLTATCEDGCTPLRLAQIHEEHEIERMLQNHAA
ncbi:MAG TPA: ankyrin repeat domain-containing protein [Verrucomicrobiae bacterium]